MAFGVMRRPAETFGVLRSFSRNLGLVGFAGFVVLGATVEDGFDGKEEFGEVGAGPFCETPNKRFNHWMKFTF
jgi:hypothetical protein